MHADCSSARVSLGLSWVVTSGLALAVTVLVVERIEAALSYGSVGLDFWRLRAAAQDLLQGQSVYGDPIVYDLPSKTGGRLLNSVARRLLAKERLDDRDPIPRLLEGYAPQLWSVQRLQDPLGAAFRLYGRDNVRARQLVLPDAAHRMPWEPGYGMPRQPMLFTGPSGEAPRPSEGRHFLD